jgi:hypothetical protein
LSVIFPGSLAGKKEKKPIADFVQKTVNKTAVRELTTPIATVTSFNTLVEGVINENPFGCVGYTTRDGETIDPIVRNRVLHVRSR